ncbi:MAG: hypothetical protein LBS26_01930 [Campylobacteraceae bacterium]|nr:hypothetical protein [Campylobacteraceae bacterium]
MEPIGIISSVLSFLLSACSFLKPKKQIINNINITIDGNFFAGLVVGGTVIVGAVLFFTPALLNIKR